MSGASVIAVIGGGAAGTLAAIHLARLRSSDLGEVVVVDPAARLGEGAAYSTRSPSHLLNVRAAGMSALPDDAGDFLAWTRRLGVASDGATFVPRLHYGAYLRDTLTAATTGGGTRVTQHRASARRLRGTAHGWVVELVDGSELAADQVILATGNRAAPFPGPAHPGSIADPWQPEAMATLRDRDRVLIVGSGLTAMDVALSLRDEGHRGSVRMVSRHGLLPERHADVPLPTEGPALLPGDGAALDVRLALRTLRAAAASRPDWRSVVDGLRPVTIELWRGLPDPQRARFGRHVARHWEVSRHRMAPQVADAIAGMRRQGTLRVDRGRIMGITEDGDSLRVALRGTVGDEVVRVDALVLCVGPSADPRHDPFLRGLIEDGHARVHRSGMGLDVDSWGRVTAQAGSSSPGLWVMGMLRRGAEWESTAVPELRVQARDIASRILDPDPSD